MEPKIYKTAQEIIDEMNSSSTWFENHIKYPFFNKIINPIQQMWYNLTRFPANLKKWWNFIWNDYDWDYVNTFKALEIKCRAQAKCLENGTVSNAKKYANQAYKCAEALKRLQEDNYNVDSVNEKDIVKSIKQSTAKRNNDLKIVQSMIPNMLKWWD